MEQKKESKSKLCAAAKRYPTKGKAYEAFSNDQGKNGIYLIEEIINGQIKHVCYGRCCNSVQDNELCHIHENQKKKEKSGFLYFEKDIKNKCDDVKIKKANASMSYFKQMGDRGRNKTSKTTYHDFKNEDDPILKIIKFDKNPKLLKDLKIHAIQLLNSQNIAVKVEKEDETIKNDTNGPSKNKELLETIERLNLEHQKKLDIKEESLKIKKKSNDNEILDIIDEINEISDIDEESSINSEEIPDNNIFDTIQENNDKNIENNTENIENNQEDDEYDVEPIYTNKGKLLYLEPFSNNIIEPEGDSDGTSIGILYKIDKKYSNIKKDNEFYTVLSQNKLKNGEIEYFRDVLNDRIFEMIDDTLIFRGRVTKKNDSSYKFHFD